MRARQISHVLWIVAGASVLGGCGWDATLTRFVRPEDDAFARAYFDSVRTGRIDYAVAVLGPVAAGIPGVRDSLALFATSLPAGPVDSLHVIGVNRFRSSTEDRSSLTYEYHSAQGWGVISILIAGRSIEGISGNHLKQSLELGNAFSFRAKGAGHYLMFLLFLACLGTALWVAVLALRTKMNRRWAWALLALVGAGTVMFNWTTGQVGFQLLNVLFLDAAFGRAAPAAPWIFQTAFPIGALMTWRHIQKARTATPALDVSVPAEPAIDVDSHTR